MKSKILGLLAVGLLAGPMSAGAVIVKWTLDNAVFNDGTVASGWFDYDSAAGSAVDWLIVTQDGTKDGGGGFSGGGGAESFAGFTYDRTSGSAFSFFGDSRGIAFTGDIDPRYFNLAFVNLLPASGGTVPLGTQWPYVNTAVSSYECDNCSKGRYLVSGNLIARAAAVPEPGTLALLGLGLAGLGLSRRRKA